MKDAVKSRVSRILSRMNSFRSFDSENHSLMFPFSNCLSGMGRVFGVYVNSPDDLIFVADRGLLLCLSGKTHNIFYDQIRTADVVESPKEDAKSISIQEMDGTSITFAVQNGTPGTRDTWEFWRFLDRVYRDVQSNKNHYFEKLSTSQVSEETYKPKMVVFSDEVDVGAHIKSLLAKESIQVTVCQLNSHIDFSLSQFDLIIIDITIETQSSEAFVNHLLKNRSNVPVLALTGEEQTKSIKEFKYWHTSANLKEQEFKSKILSILKTEK